MERMSSAATTPSSTKAFADLSREELLVSVADLAIKLKTTEHQLDWFKRQLFGEKSEKRFMQNPNQLGFGMEGYEDVPEEEDKRKEQTVTYTRKNGPKRRPEDCVTDCGLRFDASVPVKTIRLTPDEIEGLDESQYEIIGVEKTYRLAQRPASSVVLCYERPVVKLKQSGSLCRALVPVNVIERSAVEVSFIAGMLVDKFEYHLPLYRQHQRLIHAGITLSRTTLTNVGKQAIELLRPIVDAQLLSVLSSQTLAMDETSIKAGPSKKRPGKMQQGYFWPMYGDKDEMVFAFAVSRGKQVIEQLLGVHFSGTLIADGYAAYAAWAKGNERVTLAQCWVHSRRQFVNAHDGEEQAVNQVLEIIGRLYKVEADARDQALEGELLREHRLTHAKPIVDEVYAWRRWQCTRMDLLPSDPFTLALKYLGDREHELRVFLADPSVPLDTNHVERGLRRIPMGKKNYLFCWTELGAEHVGIIQSLISTCRLHDINPYTYLVDVLQRVSIHPASRVEELTPRLWKEHFANNPLRSDIYDSG
jgi:transposase